MAGRVVVRKGGGDTAVTGGPVTPPVAAVEMPEPFVVDAVDARPSVLLVGGSGTGKTHSIARLLAAGLRGLVVAVERKYQGLMQYRPTVLDLTVNSDGKTASTRQMYDRLMRFGDLLREGKYRVDGDGKPYDFIATDGVMEAGQVIHAYRKGLRTVSRTTGEQNTFALWEGVAEDLVRMFHSWRDAAGIASSMYGLPPVGIIVTCGEETVETKAGVRYPPFLPGKLGPKHIPYAFEVVLRLACEEDAGHVMYTRGTEEFYAKAPTQLYEEYGGKIEQPDFAEVYRRLVDSYRVVDADKEA